MLSPSERLDSHKLSPTNGVQITWTDKRGPLSRPRARLTESGRWLLVQRVEREGWTVAATAEAAGVSRETVYRWLRRWEAERGKGLCDRSSRPQRSPRRLAALTGDPRSTCYAVLRRFGLARRTSWTDPRGE